MVVNGISFPDEAIAEFCRRRGVRRLSLYGSILSKQFRPDSDIDILVEFEPGLTPGMIGFGDMILELSRMLGRRVDLRTPYDLSIHLRPLVQADSILLHAA